MATSVLKLVNKVLRKLRESTVNSIENNDYAELITDLLTETKMEVEQSFDWSSLQSKKSLTSVASQSQYEITGSPESSKIRTVYDQTNDTYLTFAPKKVREGLRLASPEEGDPIYYMYSGESTDGDMLIDVYPVPSTSGDTYIVDGKWMEGDIIYTSPSTNMISTPMTPLVLGTYARAIDERGEVDGESFTKAMIKYERALSTAIQIENARQGDEETTWEVE